jgi:hypothetical protein
MRPLLIALAAVLPLAAADIDVGAVDQKAPTKEALTAPKKDTGIATVELKGTVKGKAAKDAKGTLYVAVAPLGKDGTASNWWIQGEVNKDGAAFSADAQFGEEAAGAGEYFAVIALVSDEKWMTGDMLDKLPPGTVYSKVTIVKRK